MHVLFYAEPDVCVELFLTPIKRTYWEPTFEYHSINWEQWYTDTLQVSGNIEKIPKYAYDDYLIFFLHLALVFIQSK